MAELTQEQIDQAVKAYEHDRYGTTEYHLRAAAPFLQLSWEPPMAGEINAIFDTMQAADASTFAVVCEFVRRRNAALQPKPDPRIAKLVVILDTPWVTQEDRAVNILAALDEVKR